MKRSLFVPFAVLVVLAVLMTSNATCQALNPYLPHNAIAAQPPLPYYQGVIPNISRTYYDPCPSCGPVSKQFPDLPPVQQPFPGIHGIPVPVP